MSIALIRILGLMGFLALGAVAGCGGGASPAPSPVDAPKPPPPPPTTTPPPVTIFENPNAQEYVSVGASTTDAGDGYNPVSQDARLLSVSFDGPNQPLIRYDAGGFYEIKLPGMNYDRLVHYRGRADPTADNNFFQPASVAQNKSTFIITQSRLQGYEDSELASWTKSDNLSGYVAFGVATPTSAIPSEGSATYSGEAIGMVDITYADYLFGGYYFSGAAGKITLKVDFASNRITGSVTFSVSDGTDPRDIGTYAIAPAADLLGFSTSFPTSQAGFNQFNGVLTGSAAQEAIGNWALTVMIDGEPHQLFGAWIAKRSLNP